MRSSASKVLEIFYRADGEPIRLHPRFCIDEGIISFGGSSRLAEGITLREQLKRKPDSKICFYRTYALGDVILLTPIFNWVKEKYPASTVYLVTVSAFTGLFKYWDLIKTVDKRAIDYLDYDVGYYLDGVVEKDHEGGRLSHMHRLDIYCEFVGVDVPKDPIFSLPFSDAEKSWAESIVGPIREPGKPVLAIQVSGATKTRRFPLGKWIEIAEDLVKDFSIIFLHNFYEEINVKEVVNLGGQTSVQQVVALLDCVDAVVTLDSGILWMAHCTKTPIIALLGHTREEERMTYHRNYHVVNLSEMVGCEACFGRMDKCGGAIRCMTQVSGEDVARGIRDGIRKLIYC
jgi:ADP-heptose:LPS heptosyltransferase